MSNRIDAQTGTKVSTRAEQLAKAIEDELETVAGDMQVPVGPAFLQGLQTQLVGKDLLAPGMALRPHRIGTAF